MYLLNRIKDIEEFTYDEQDIFIFRRDSSLDTRKKQFEALKWAMENPEYDFMEGNNLSKK